MTDAPDPKALANAALMSLIGNGLAIQAAIIRKAPREEVETLRDQGRAYHEAYMDQTEAKAREVSMMTDDPDLIAQAMKRLFD